MAAELLGSVGIEVLAGVVVGLGNRARAFARADRDRVRLIQGELLADEQLRGALDAAARALTEATPDPALGGERLRRFLRSDECRTAIEPLFAADVLAAPALVRVRANFVALLQLQTGLADDAAAVHGERLFDAFANGATRALEVALSDSSVHAHELMSRLRHQLLALQLDNIDENLTLLAASRETTYAQIVEFRDRLRAQIAQREGFIVPPRLDERVKRPLDELYVAPRLSERLLPDSGADEPQTFGFGELLEQLDRTVVVGDPGGGKTTLTKKIALDLCRTPPDTRDDGVAHPVLAIPVTLRDYARHRESIGLLAYVEQLARTRYQVEEVPPGAVAYLLRNGLAVVLFDGLDELVATDQRREVADDVESFASRFPTTPILVTSRKVGYDEAPLDRERFTVLQLASLDDEQVREYAQKTFALDPLAGEDEETSTDERVEAFMQESQSVSELRSNPLLLGLMCSLYAGTHHIPANLPGIYEKCALMMFDRWDRSRRIGEVTPYESVLRPALQHLAAWIFGDAEREEGVRNEQLVAQMTEFLHEHEYPQRSRAYEAAIAVVEACKGRAWVFTDTGTLADGEPLFQFTHRTFLEYFAAANLASVHHTPQELAAFMSPYVAQREWQVVLQLAAQIKSDQLRGGVDLLLGRLLDDAAAETERRRRVNLLSFASESLQFLVPKPATVERLVALDVELLSETWMAAGDYSPDDQPIWMPLGLLMSAGPRTHETVTGLLVARLIGHANETRDPVLVAAIMHFRFAALYARFDFDVFDLAADVTDAVVKAISPLIGELAGEDPPTAASAVEIGVIDHAAAVASHGVSILFATWWDHARILAHSSLSAALLYDALAGSGAGPLAPLTAIVRATPPPWSRHLGLDDDEPPQPLVRSLLHRDFRLARTPDDLFVAFAVFAVEAEHGRLSQFVDSGTPDPTLHAIVEEIAARSETAHAAAERLFGGDDLVFVRRWIDGQIALVGELDANAID